MKQIFKLTNVGVSFNRHAIRHRSLKHTLFNLLDESEESSKFNALNEIGVSIFEGEHVGLIGRNGAGKTTLMRVLTRVITPQVGGVYVDSAKHVVPLLELGIGFHGDLSGRENCLLAGILMGYSQKEIEEKVPDILEFSELGEFFEEPVKTYSSGMYARLAFALATDINPDVLLVDEVFGVGDEFFMRKCIVRMQRLMRSGTTTVFVSHNLDFLVTQCQRLIWLDKGRIVMDGELLQWLMLTEHQGKTMTEPIIVNATNLGKYIDGLGVYTLNLVRELSQIKHSLRLIIYANVTAKDHLKEIVLPPNCEIRWTTRFVSPDYRFRGHLLRLLYSNYLALKHRRSLMFIATQLEALFFHSNQIITIHDIIPMLFRRTHKKQYFYYKYLLGRALRTSTTIITPSQHTKNLLIQTYAIDEAKVRVIHNGVRQSLDTALNRSSNPDEKFILFTGRLVEMKNVEGLLRAFSMIMQSIPHKLIITGHGTESMKRKLQVLRSNECRIDENRIEYKGHVSSEELIVLYRNASMLVFPSFYEGFGLPPLEGMAHGCPVVVSNVSSLPEVCADAAMYVDPYDANSIAKGMKAMLLNPFLRQMMVVKGVERAKQFRWEDSARKHMEVFQKALARNEESMPPQPAFSPAI